MGHRQDWYSGAIQQNPASGPHSDSRYHRDQRATEFDGQFVHQVLIMGTPETTIETPEQKQFRQFMNNISQTRSNLDAIETLITKYPGIVSVPYVIKPTLTEPTIYLAVTSQLIMGVKQSDITHKWGEYSARLGQMILFRILGVKVIFIDDLNEVR